MDFRRALSRYPAFWGFVTSLYALVFVTADFWGSPVTGLRGFMALAMQWLIVAFCSGGVIGLICAGRYVFAVLFPLLTVFSSVLAYFKLTLGMGLTPMAIELTLVNDLRTWSTMISWQLVAIAACTLVVSAGIAWWRFRFVRTEHGLDYAFLSCLIIMLPCSLVARIKAPVASRMPYVFYYAASQYLDNRKTVAEERHTFDNEAAVCGEDSIDVVFIIGESLRADHLQLNGYGRPTTPRLMKERNIVSFREMYTEPCYTHVSVPRIMTRADSVNPERAYDEQSFITLFRKAGFRTVWFTNQDVASSYVYFMHEADTLIYANASKTLYDYDKWMDMDLLPHFDREGLAGKRNLSVMHTIGSHWWYKSHYDSESAVFMPDIDSRVVSELSREQMVNAYDNTVVETDRFISAIIGRLRNRNAVLLYVSDHGEALGENGNYLHGDDYPELHNPAAFVWWSDEYGRRNPEKVKALRSASGKRHTTDVMFHSVLDAASVECASLDTLQSIFVKKIGGQGCFYRSKY